MLGQPKATIPIMKGQIRFVREAIQKARHDEVIKIEAMSYNQLLFVVEDVKNHFKHSHTLTHEHFTSGGRLWAYILIKFKNVA